MNVYIFACSTQSLAPNKELRMGAYNVDPVFKKHKYATEHTFSQIASSKSYTYGVDNLMRLWLFGMGVHQ